MASQSSPRAETVCPARFCLVRGTFSARRVLWKVAMVLTEVFLLHHSRMRYLQAEEVEMRRDKAIVSTVPKTERSV